MKVLVEMKGLLWKYSLVYVYTGCPFVEIRSEYYEPKPEARVGMYHGFPYYPPYDPNIPTPPHHPRFALWWLA